MRSKRQVQLGYVQQRGTAMIEAAIILPLAIVIMLSLMQLIWIFWAQQTLHLTSHYVLRAGTLQHGQMQPMQNTLATGMASTQVVNVAKSAAAMSDQERRQLAWQTTAAALAHAKLASRIQVMTPNAEQVSEFAQPRYDLRSQTWVNEIAVDHPQLRVQQVSDELAWQAALQLELEIWWCLPLRIPLAAPIFQRWRSLDSPAQRFCFVREAMLGQPLWPLVTKRKGPMQSGFRPN